MRTAILISILLAAMLLGGCAGQHDPRTGGFFGGVAGLGGGSYKDRVAEREARLAELRNTQRELESEKGQLESQKSAAQAQLDKDQARVKAMQTEIAALDKKTKSLAAKDGADKQRVADLQKRVTDLKGKMNKQASSLDDLEGSGLGDADMDLRRKQLEAQRDALRKEYDLLMKMQMELAQ
jgi:chromosome segregation ATPase